MALKNKVIAGAALDVFKIEPLAQESRLWALDNIIITAHNADNTPSYINDAFDVYVRNFELFVNGDTLPTINVELGY